MTSLFGYLSYRDPQAAIAWLEAIGFEITARQASDDGAVLHAELRLSDAVVARNRRRRLRGPAAGRPLDRQRPLPARRGGRAIYAAAIEAGATSVFEPEATEWGSERTRVLDPEGHQWSFGSYEPRCSW